MPACEIGVVIYPLDPMRVCYATASKPKERVSGVDHTMFIVSWYKHPDRLLALERLVRLFPP